MLGANNISSEMHLVKKHLTLCTPTPKKSLHKVGPRAHTPQHHKSHTSPVQEATVQDVDDAVAAAGAAFPAWRDTSIEVRGSYMQTLSKLILESNAELAKLEALSMGRPVSGFFDAALAAEYFSYFATAAWSAQGTASLHTPDQLSMTVRQPYGVVGLIIPWNFPLVLLAGKVAPAIAAGNTVVLKSSEKAPLTVGFLRNIPIALTN